MRCVMDHNAPPIRFIPAVCAIVKRLEIPHGVKGSGHYPLQCRTGALEKGLHFEFISIQKAEHNK